ncbi:MAG: hypothetical protein U5R48_19435 [Gammaproteobacteria bacterium]|nr:hypothetical protein [Gammaproteobacteria bacterium]
MHARLGPRAHLEAVEPLPVVRGPGAPGRPRRRPPGAAGETRPRRQDDVHGPLAQRPGAPGVRDGLIAATTPAARYRRRQRASTPGAWMLDAMVPAPPGLEADPWKCGWSLSSRRSVLGKTSLALDLRALYAARSSRCGRHHPREPAPRAGRAGLRPGGAGHTRGPAAPLRDRLQQRERPLGWFLGQVWDRFTHRSLVVRPGDGAPCATRAICTDLVNASENPEFATYIDSELDILEWLEVRRWCCSTSCRRRAAEVRTDGSLLATGPGPPSVEGRARADAFERCWIEESRLLLTAAETLGRRPPSVPRPAAAADLQQGQLEVLFSIDAIARRRDEVNHLPAPAAASTTGSVGPRHSSDWPVDGDDRGGAGIHPGPAGRWRRPRPAGRSSPHGDP